MKLKILISIITFLLLATTATALTLEGRCAIKFLGESTLSDFDGQAICQPFTLKTEGETGKAGIIRQPVVKVLVGKMDTDNSGRDKKMYAMFEQEKYPEIHGLFADLNPDVILQQWRASSIPGRLKFDLMIREVSQSVEATISDLIVTLEQISFVMKFPLSLASFQLEPPSVFGVIRVDDKVRVEARVFLRKPLD